MSMAPFGSPVVPDVNIISTRVRPIGLAFELAIMAALFIAWQQVGPRTLESSSAGRNGDSFSWEGSG